MPILDEQIDLLEKHAESGVQGGAADVLRSELEDVVAAELSVFRQITRSQDAYRTTEPYSDEAERRFHRRYERWLTAARRTLDRIERAASEGAAVGGVDELRGACRRAEILMLGTDTSNEEIEQMENAAPSPETLRALAAKYRPPQEWYDQTDCPFKPEAR